MRYLLALLLVACSGGSSGGGDCQAVLDAIRKGALEPRLPNYPNGYDGNGDGKPDSIGICSSKDPTIMKDFGDACAKLHACELDVPEN